LMHRRFVPLNVHGEARAPLLRASLSTVRLDGRPSLLLRNDYAFLLRTFKAPVNDFARDLVDFKVITASTELAETYFDIAIW